MYLKAYFIFCSHWQCFFYWLYLFLSGTEDNLEELEDRESIFYSNYFPCFWSKHDHLPPSWISTDVFTQLPLVKTFKTGQRVSSPFIRFMSSRRALGGRRRSSVRDVSSLHWLPCSRSVPARLDRKKQNKKTP